MLKGYHRGVFLGRYGWLTAVLIINMVGLGLYTSSAREKNEKCRFELQVTSRAAKLHII